MGKLHRVRYPHIYLPDITLTNSRPNDATEIFFLGVGDAFYGLANLLINRETIYNRVSGVISYVGKNPVRAISSHNDPNLSRWYKSVSCPP